MKAISTLTQAKLDQLLGQRIRELARELGQPVYIPPTVDEHGTIQVITLEDMLEIDPDAVDVAGEFQPVIDDENG